MAQRCAVVLDVGKTNSKLTLWDAHGRLLQRRVRSNEPDCHTAYRALDVHGIDAWLLENLRDYARAEDVGTIIPVAHGAAAALISAGRLFAAPMDYEVEVDADQRRRYDAARDAFTATGSPALPLGLNLGVQLQLLESLTTPWPADTQILTWPQYWAWRLCGIAATEVTSLGCHSDLWRPLERRFSDLAIGKGWANRMAPLRHAGDALGPITAEVAAHTGLPRDCQVLTGLHDSNAALLAARGYAELGGNDATVLSTGTWFVAMRSPLPGTAGEPASLAEARDCLINVDIDGNAVPSSRFMGGREAEIIAAPASASMSATDAQARLARLLATGSLLRPSFCKGCGPFPNVPGGWIAKPDDPLDIRVMTDWYLALMADVVLDQIESRDRLLVEGRFAESPIFVQALAALRPTQRVLVSSASHDVSYGALRLLDPRLSPPGALTVVAPLDADLLHYAKAWLAEIETAEKEHS